MDPIKRRVLTGVVSLGALIFIVELLIMELLPDLLPELPAGTFRWLDPIVLILVLLPFLHLLVIRPLLQHSEELLRAKQAERRFLSNMSHEIRTPLNAITGLVGLMEESPLSPEQGGHLQSVRHASEHLLALINDVLDLNRIEQGALRLEPAFFSLRRLEAEVRQVFTPMFGGRSVRFTVTNRLTADIRILGDQLRIKQVLYNLIGNATKFTESGSVELEISARPLTGNRIELALAVRDTGPGMSADTADRLFTDYFQRNPLQSPATSGAGLGLTISHRLVLLMDGVIRVRTAEGKGSEFTVVLPVEFRIETPGHDDPTPLSLDPERRIRRQGCRILVAEDNRVNLVITQRLLGAAGYASDNAADGREALSAIERRRYDLVLMDCQMPNLDGLEATRILRRRGFDRPVVALTANAFESDREQCLKAGMDDFIAKPITSEKLVALVDRFLLR